MLIALPNLDGSFTATLFLPNTGKNSIEELNATFIAHHFPDFYELVEDEIQLQLDTFPVSKLLTLSCNQWFYQNSCALLGDAAHAILPFYGQGMNAGFEDVFTMYEVLKKEDPFKLYQKLRKENCDAIKVLADRNFIEMRDGVVDNNYLIKKSLNDFLFKHLSQDWIPSYSMVSFSLIPYAEVLERTRHMDLVMENLIDKLQISEPSEIEMASTEILSYIKSHM